jgi:hypothetical protein
VGEPNIHSRSPLRPESPFHQLSCILRVSSPRQLDLTSIFELANRNLAALFPGEPAPFVHRHRTEYLEEALELAVQYGIHLEVLLNDGGGGHEMGFIDDLFRRLRRLCFTPSPPQPTLTQRASMIPLAQKVTMYRAQPPPTLRFPRAHFVSAIVCSPRLSRTSRPCYSQ